MLNFLLYQYVTIKLKKLHYLTLKNIQVGKMVEWLGIANNIIKIEYLVCFRFSNLVYILQQA